MGTSIVPTLNPAQLDQLSNNTIRFLSVDAVQKAKSGHPDSPLSSSLHLTNYDLPLGQIKLRLQNGYFRPPTSGPYGASDTALRRRYDPTGRSANPVAAMT